MQISCNFRQLKIQEICNPFEVSSARSKNGLFNPWGLPEILYKENLGFYIENKIESRAHERIFSKNELNQAKIYHYSRIAYFINNSWTDEILLKFGDVEYDYWPGWSVINGNHRYCAALYLEQETILGKIVALGKDFDYTKFLA